MIVKAVMVPHPPIALHEVGKGEEHKIQNTLDAYHIAAKEIAEVKPETVIVISPHAVMYRDYFQVSSGKEAYGDMGRFRARQVQFHKQYDEEFTTLLTRLLSEKKISGGCEYDSEPELDHGTMVPLYFLDQVYQDYRLVRIGLSGLPMPVHYRLGQAIAETAEKLGRRTAVIGSGDLSHCQKADGPYGYHEAGPEYDKRIMDTMGRAAFGELFSYPVQLLSKAQECGHRSFVIMAGALDGLAVKPHILSHEATFGVGYGIITYDILGKDDNRHFLNQYENSERERLQNQASDMDPFVLLAKKAIAFWVTKRQVLPIPNDVPEELLNKQAGCFVSIHESGALRGCIGTIFPVRDHLASEIIQNAVSACSKDPRFLPVRTEELELLEINVDVLKAPQRISSRAELDAKKYGVICSLGMRKGVLLPDLEGVDTPEEQIQIACQKGGIDPADENLVIERFEVIRHV